MVLCREKTERPEALHSGTVALVWTDRLLVRTVAEVAGLGPLCLMSQVATRSRREGVFQIVKRYGSLGDPERPEVCITM